MKRGETTAVSLDTFVEEFGTLAIQQDVAALSDELGSDTLSDLDLKAILEGSN
jgi:hypothetical protein